jgi:hypothetical protein
MPATSDKQRKFMGADLGRLRSGKPTKTGMTETQLKDYAGTKVSKKLQEHSGRSIIDVEFHDRKPGLSSVSIPGHPDKPGERCHEGQDASHEQLSSWKARDSHNVKAYKADVCEYGPDTSFRVEEINPYHYGRDYEPSPFRDYFKDQKKDDRDSIRLLEEYEYEDMATPGAVPDHGIESSEAYGAISYTKVKTEENDNRSFKDQRRYGRSQAELEDDHPTVKNLKP